MSIWFYVWIAIAVALGVYIWMEFSKDSKKGWDVLSKILTWAAICWLAVWIIYLLFLWGVFLWNKISDPKTLTMIKELLLALGRMSLILVPVLFIILRVSRDEKKLTKEQKEKKEKRHKRNDKILYGCLIFLFIAAILIVGGGFIYDKFN